MSSALAAFAKTQAAPPAAEVAGEDDANASEGECGTQEQTVTVSTPRVTLADAASTQQQEHPAKKTMTLVDVAQEKPLQQRASSKPTTTLMDVARRQEAQQRQVDCNQLSELAAQVQAEAQTAADRCAQKIKQALTATSEQVQRELRVSRTSQVQQALQLATQEELASYNQQDDAFEKDDPAIPRAAARVVQVSSEPHSKHRRVETLSVDRHVLKQRQNRHGLTAKSTPKAKTLKDKLSSFQFQQLSLTQQRVSLAMLVNDNHNVKAAKKTCNMHAIQELAKDRATQLTEKRKLLKIKAPRYAKLDDDRHCRFKPKIKTVGSSTGDRHEDESDGDAASNQRSEDFIRRMEATERVRNEQLRRTRAERQYLAQIDKKECPMCGNPQSYAELSQKRQKCPNCGVTYKSRLAWSEVADEFLARMQAHLDSRLKREQADNQVRDHTVILHQKRKKWRDVRDEFLGRIQLDLAQREMTKELIFHELEAQCTFTPMISDRAKRLQLAKFDERLRRDLENRRIRQEQNRLLTAAITTTEVSVAAKPKTLRYLQEPFAQRLQQDLQQRRQRLARNGNAKATGISSRRRGLY